MKPIASSEVTLHSIEPITTSSAQVAKTRERLQLLVEAPLLEAVQILYDKNIQTFASSANKKDIVSGEAYIIIDFDTLSEDNKLIAQKLGSSIEYRRKKAIKICIPIEEKVSVQEVRRKALEIVSHFKEQRMSWAPKYTLDEIRESLGGAEPDSETLAEYYYDPKSGFYFFSEEHFRKANPE